MFRTKKTEIIVSNFRHAHSQVFTLKFRDEGFLKDFQEGSSL